MTSINDCKLYVITGENYHRGRELLDVMEAAIRGGADIVQLRDKDAAPAELLEKARALRELTRRLGVLFIVNDHPGIALESDADGVHLGQDDLPIEDARRMLGPERIVGISTHSIAQARAAEKAGADYIGVGPVFPTGTKPGRAAVTTAYVAEAAAEIRIPFFAIGGIHPGNADEVLAAGAKRLCTVSAVVGSPDPAAVCRDLRERIERRWDGRLEHGVLGHGGRDGSRNRTEIAYGEIRGVGPGDGELGTGRPGRGGERENDPASERQAATTIVLNGRPGTTAAATLLGLAEELSLGEKRVVAERNGVVVPRAAWPETEVAEGDRIEFVHFVGGG